MAKVPARFGEFKYRAKNLVQSPSRLARVVAQAVKKLGSMSGDKATEAKGQLSVFIALLKAWLAGDYRQVSNRTIVIVAAAVLYFVVPLDAIPDFLFGLGLLDDIAVVGYVFAQITEEIEAFRAWQVRECETQSAPVEAKDLAS